MPTTFQVISLGVLPDIDTIEGDTLAEDAAELVGMTFGGVGDPLVNDFVTFAPGTGGYGGGDSVVYDQDNDPAENFTINGGVDQVFDSGASFTATVTYIDGTTASITAAIIQDVAGNTYWAPEFSDNADQAAIEAAAIRSLEITGVNADIYSGMEGDRETWSYVTCFTPGVLIDTDQGPRRVEELAAGDVVLTREAGLQPIRWMSTSTRPAVGSCAPVRIAAHALGPGCPAWDMEVSQQHRVLVCSNIIERFTGQAEGLVAAKHLVGLPGITLAERPGEDVHYIHILLDGHHLVRSNGAWSESLLLGPLAERCVGAKGLAEIALIDPGLMERCAVPAAAILERTLAARVLEKHRARMRPIYDYAKAVVHPQADGEDKGPFGDLPPPV